jgi:hypothetical protein
MTKQIKIKNLYCDTVHNKAQDFNFGIGYTETWEIPLNLTESEQENEEYAPMMNYLYPLPDEFTRDMENRFGEDWQTKIKNKLNNMTVVYLIDQETYFLALTGGGMDMSWQICETYINLGYLPPLTYCDLPNMAGTNYNSAKTKRIIKACKRSAQVAIIQAKSTLRTLKSLHNYSTNKPQAEA